MDSGELFRYCYARDAGPAWITTEEKIRPTQAGITKMGPQGPVFLPRQRRAWHRFNQGSRISRRAGIHGLG